ncbi:hypothetical protein RN001_010425 [Aquatica leii]|uniref:Cytochrome P450 n=1 Tax=Aquatica leii TaxID=1421715 RepID=A0AAN7SG06_9COLE|nr:hypothetical protein RN001_010425 [Aquatica leii]
MENPIKKKTYDGVTYAKFYKTMKERGEKHMGYFNMIFPRYVPIDLEIVKNVLERHFDYFNESGLYYNEKDDPVSAHLVALGGKKWKTLRAKVSPAFTQAKIKTMFDTTLHCAKQMIHALDYRCTKAIDSKDISSRFTIDVIGSCAFGLECNSFKSTGSEFHQKSKKVFAKPDIIRRIFKITATIFPNLGRALGIKVLAKDVSKFYLDVAQTTFTHRKTNGIKRNDVFQAIMDLGDEITIQEIAAQCFIFFTAGYETTATTLAYCLYELSRDLEIQYRARNEVFWATSKFNGEITYQAVEQMKYLEQIVFETLRKYPPVTFIGRDCVKDYKSPNFDLVLEKGTRVVISIMGIHHDEEYYPDPEKFDPDRFTEENRKKMKPFSYMPFGEGPRMCIGKRFALMEIKTALSVLLKNYSFEVNPSVKHPLSWETFTIILTSKEKIWLDLKRLSA